MVARSTGNTKDDSVTSENGLGSLIDDAFQGKEAYGEKPPEDNRTSRAMESREGDEIHESYQDQWTQSGLLDTKNIPPRPGFVQRWVRTKLGGMDDPKNVMQKMNQGYRPRNANTVPKGSFAPTVNTRQFGDIIGMDGIVLMERPEKLHKSHAAHNAAMANRQMEAVNGILAQAQEPGKGFGPVNKTHSSSVDTGHRPAPVSDDD